ncbi:MAG: hypothetical protein M1358_21515 [Chloroflexi bacterium]|nr:hypothetical protein [Chloroflexota bacterium]
MDEQLAKGAQIILNSCMGLRPGERLAVICDPEKGETGRALASAAQKQGAQAILLEGYYTFDRLEDALPAMVEAVASSDVIIYLVSYARTQFLGHTDLRRNASARGARQAFITVDIRGLSEDMLEECRRNTLRVGDMLTCTKVARVTSEIGTDVTMRLSGKKALCLTHVLREPGDWGALPTFVEAAIGVAEGSAEGVAVVDGMITDLGRVSRPIRVTMAGGIVTCISGGREADELKRVLDEAGENAYNVAELGLGTNPFAKERVGGFEDKKIFGTAHFGLGDGATFGSLIKSRIHLDVLMERPTIELDGKILIKDGQPVG